MFGTTGVNKDSKAERARLLAQARAKREVHSVLVCMAAKGWGACTLCEPQTHIVTPRFNKRQQARKQEREHRKHAIILQRFARGR